MLNPAGSLAGKVGKGLVAGAIGTAVMTAGQAWDSNRRNRGASTSPADATEKVLDVEFSDDQAKVRASKLVHWGYGSALGVVRAFLPLVGIRGTKATIVHFAVVWGGALVMLPALDVAPPAPEWGSEELAVSGAHHLVYALATGLAFGLLDTGRA